MVHRHLRVLFPTACDLQEEKDEIIAHPQRMKHATPGGHLPKGAPCEGAKGGPLGPPSSPSQNTRPVKVLLGAAMDRVSCNRVQH